MTKIITTLFVFIGLSSYGQKRITLPPQDFFDSSVVNTVRISGDSSFVVVSRYNKSILVYREEVIQIRLKAISTHCFGETNTSSVYAIMTIRNGNSTAWHPNGNLKFRGVFLFDKLKSGWKFWTESGKEISEEKNEKNNSTPLTPLLSTLPQLCARNAASLFAIQHPGRSD